MEKHINNDNINWTKVALLKLIYIEKRNIAKQKLVKKSGDKV